MLQSLFKREREIEREGGEKEIEFETKDEDKDDEDDKCSFGTSSSIGPLICFICLPVFRSQCQCHLYLSTNNHLTEFLPTRVSFSLSLSLSF